MLAGAFPPLDLCLDGVRRSDALVLILGSDLTDPTRREFEVACEIGIPRLIFVKQGSRNKPAREFLESVAETHTYVKFRNSGELEAQLEDHLLRNMAHAFKKQPRVGLSIAFGGAS